MTATEVDDFNLECSTGIYTSVETYLYSLNTDTRLGIPTMDEVNLLDRAFELAEVDSDAAKNLVVAFLNQYLHPVDKENKPVRAKKVLKKPISNRKLRRQNTLPFRNSTRNVEKLPMTRFIIRTRYRRNLIATLCLTIGNTY